MDSRLRVFLEMVPQIHQEVCGSNRILVQIQKIILPNVKEMKYMRLPKDCSIIHMSTAWYISNENSSKIHEVKITSKSKQEDNRKVS